RRLGHPGEAVGDAGGLEDAPDLVVEVDCTRQWIGGGLLLEDPHPPSPLPEEDGERLPDRTVADDRDVVAVAHRALQSCAPIMGSAGAAGGRKDGGTGGPQV